MPLSPFRLCLALILVIPTFLHTGLSQTIDARRNLNVDVHRSPSPVVEETRSDIFHFRQEPAPLPFPTDLRFHRIQGPRIGLVLSGGGARGLSQVGVLKALEEEGIVPDLIIGTSIGSIVGGLTASGYSARDLESALRSIDWAEVLTLGNQIGREHFAVDQKVQSDRSVLTIRFDGLRPMLPTAVSNGQRLTNLLNRLVLQAPYHATKFDSLRIPFRAVATDLYTGSRIVLSEGSLVEALRASTTIPVMYAPVLRDTLALVDGGLRANIAVDLARQAGCDLVIAVNTTSPMRTEKDIRNPLDALDQVLNVMMAQNNAEQLRLADLVITPSIQEYSATDFEKADTLVALGYAVGVPAAARVHRWRDSVLSRRALPEPWAATLESDARWQVHFTGAPPEDLRDTVLTFADVIHLATHIQERDDLAQVRWTVDPEGSHRILAEVTPRPTIQQVTILGAGVLSAEDRDSLFHQTLPAPLGRTSLQRFCEKLIQRFRIRGYSLAEISGVAYDTTAQTLRIEVSEGRIGEIQIAGNQITKPHVILREFPLRVGDVFNIEAAQRGMGYISALNLFHQVHFDVPFRDTVNTVRISVDERSNRFLQIGTLIDNERNAQAMVEFRDANLFGGGTEASVLFFGGLRNQRLSFRYNSNKLFYTPLSFMFTAEGDGTEYYGYEERTDLPSSRFERRQTSSYRRLVYGLRGGVGMYVQRFGFLTAFARAERHRITSDNPSFATSEMGVVVLGASSTIDTRDRNPLPSKGIYLHVMYSSAQKAFGSSLSFTKLNGVYDLYVSSSDRILTFHPRLLFGYGDRTMPRSEFFHLGGLDSFIGLQENEFEGRQQFVGSLEVRARLPFTLFFDTYLSARYDLGQTIDMPEQIAFTRLLHAVGVALSLNTPIGPAVFAVGRAFRLPAKNTQDPIAWSPAYLSFSIGMPLSP